MSKKVLVVGLGKSGLAACDYLLKEGKEVVGVDRCYEKPELQAFAQKHADHLFTLSSDESSLLIKGFDLVVISPGVPPTHPLICQAITERIPIVGEAELALCQISIPCIGITGSNGKTTATLLLEHVLKVAGFKAKAIGNLGIPFTSYLLTDQTEDILVCELSSFQLETLQSPVLDIGVILDITPDHLDRYESFESYAAAKLQMLSCLKPSGCAFLSRKNLVTFDKEIKIAKEKINILPSFPLMKEDENYYLQLREKREYCEILEVGLEKAIGFELLTLVIKLGEKFEIAPEKIKEAVSTFCKPAHRLEYVGEIRGVKFFNDSKATNIESVIYAISKMMTPVILIAGGKDKNLDFTQWIAPFKNRVMKIFSIGESADKINSMLSQDYEVVSCSHLQEATERALLSATAPACVLLSPGCASFDSYRNFEHRGESFKEIVTDLKKRYMQ